MKSPGTHDEGTRAPRSSLRAGESEFQNNPINGAGQAPQSANRDRQAKVNGHVGKERQPEFVPAYTKGLITLTGAELLQKEFPPREMILRPWLPEKGLAMVFA